MKRIICILITLTFIFVFASCAASDKEAAQETASSVTEQSASETAPAEETTVAETTEYKTDYGTITYPAAFQEDYEISEREEDGNHIIVFDTTVDGKDYNLFTLVMTEDETEWLMKDDEGNAHYVDIQMNEIDADDLSQEQLDYLYSMQEGINVICEHMHA